MGEGLSAFRFLLHEIHDGLPRVSTLPSYSPKSFSLPPSLHFSVSNIPILGISSGAVQAACKIVLIRQLQTWQEPNKQDAKDASSNRSESHIAHDITVSVVDGKIFKAAGSVRRPVNGIEHSIDALLADARNVKSQSSLEGARVYGSRAAAANCVAQVDQKQLKCGGLREL